jgi:sRNA-binding protein
VFLVTDVEATIKELANRYPATFVAEAWSPHRPLAIGIRDTLIAACPDLAGTITPALQRYAHRLLYLQSLTKGAPRVDLTGAAVGTNLDRRLGQIDSAVEEAARRGRTADGAIGNRRAEESPRQPRR